MVQGCLRSFFASNALSLHPSVYVLTNTGGFGFVVYLIWQLGYLIVGNGNETLQKLQAAPLLLELVSS